MSCSFKKKKKFIFTWNLFCIWPCAKSLLTFHLRNSNACKIITWTSRHSLFLTGFLLMYWRARIPSFRHSGPVICKLWQLMWQFWPKIDPENSDSEYMQHMIIFRVLALRYIQCLMAKIVSWHVWLFIQIIFILVNQ